MELESENPFEKWKILEKYIKILLETYPDPINQTEIATKAHVSKAAVSKNKDLIKFYCDLSTLAWSKKYLLKNDTTTFGQIAVFSLLSNNKESSITFLNSIYFDKSLENLRIYDNLSKTFNEYNFNQYYTEEDCKWIIKLIKNILINSKVNDNNLLISNVYLNSLNQNSGHNNKTNIVIKTMQLMSSLFSADFSFLNEEDYVVFFKIKDKSFYFICDNIDPIIFYFNDQSKQLDLKEKDSKTLNYITKVLAKALIKKVFESFTDNVYEFAKNKNYILPEKYKKINKKSSIIKKINRRLAPG